MVVQSEQPTEQLVREQAPAIAQCIQQAAGEARNEAEFRGRVARIIEDFARALDVSLQPREEYTLINGRADAVYNRFVIEYEPPRSLREKNSYHSNQHAIGQVKDYIHGLHRLERHRMERMAGVATDGSYYIFARYRNGAWRVDEPVSVDAASTELFLRYLVSLGTEKALTANNLVRDFGENKPVSRLCVRTLYEALGAHSSPKVKAIFDQWKQQFSEVCGYEGGALRADLRRLARNYGVQDPDVDTFRLFFAINSYYATFIKLLAVQVTHFYLAPKLGTGLQQVASYPSDRLLDYLRKLERGGLFRDLGITNFLEGDFFGWYLELWDDAIDRAVRRIITELANYSLVTLDVDPEQTRDLLKKLYQNVMPRDIRHRLGQYFTPDWLAERLLNQLGYEGDPGRRLLDPACGSGTFLVLAIQRVKNWAAEHAMREADVLDKILANIVGFDLDPLAVMSARTNYLLAVGDLLQHRRGEVNIPVYLADSILTPAQMEERVGEQYRMMGPEERLYRFKTVVGEFAIPGSLVSAQYVDQLAALLEESVEVKLAPSEFRQRCFQTFPLVEPQDKVDLDVLEDLYQRLLELDQAGVNGIWARIIKNAFAPLFVGQFDYIAGNPPWVNWESLPDAYRADSAWLWERYDLVARAGGEQFELGKQKRDLSMLFTYGCIDQYLQDGRKLGFVITQPVFKAPSGECFRRFAIPGGPLLHIVHTDDMVDLKPFEGASNRTSVVIIERDKATSYPVPYTLWTKTVKGRSIPQDATLDVVNAMTARRNFVAEPIDDSDRTSAWITGRAQAIKGLKAKVIGRSHHKAHAGVYTGGANGIYWVDIVAQRPDGLVVISNIPEGGRRPTESVQAPVESDLIFPLLRGRGVERWCAKPELYILVPHTEAIGWQAIPEADLLRSLPKTHAYLKHFEEALLGRAAYRLLRMGHPFYIMMDISSYTFAPYKVVWRYVAEDLTCAVISALDDDRLGRKTVIPDHRLMIVPLENLSEAHYVCALLNAIPSVFIVKAYVVGTQTSTHVLEHIRIPKFDPNSAVHRQLAELSQRAHAAAAADNQDKVQDIEAQIDELAAQQWGLTKAELREIQQSLAELRG